MERERTRRDKNFEEIIQKSADDMRLLKIALRTHDPMTLSAAITRISEKHGDELAQDVVCSTITMLMLEEDWSFILENGESSPLI